MLSFVFLLLIRMLAVLVHNTVEFATVYRLDKLVGDRLGTVAFSSGDLQQTDHENT